MDGRRLGVESICRVLQVAPSTYYASRDRLPSRRAVRDAELTPRLVELWKDNYEVYGARKLWKAARRAGTTSAATRPPGLCGRPAFGAPRAASGCVQHAATRAPADTEISSTAISVPTSPTGCG